MEQKTRGVQLNQITRHRAQQDDLYEPVTIQQIPYARHRAQKGMSVGHTHRNPWDSPPAPMDSSGYVLHHQEAWQ